MKNTFLLKLVIYALFLAFADDLSAQNKPVKKYGQLHVNGRYLQDKQNNNIMLRGQSLGWSTWWPQYWNNNTVKWLAKDFKIDVLRAAMGIEPKPGYISGDKENQIKLVKQVVDAAIKSGVYVIIDWHAHNLHLTEAKEFFDMMSATYGKYPNVIYELYNEPDKETWDEVKAYSVELIKTIRKNDPKNVILIGNPNWDQNIRQVADSPIAGFDNLMYTVHFYAATHGQWLRDDSAYALSKNIPIFVSESNGSESSGSGSMNYPEWETWFKFMEENKISWINWSVSDKAGELCSILMPNTSSEGKWKAEDLTESGKYIREKLRKANSIK